jgi:hypothetical protein
MSERTDNTLVNDGDGGRRLPDILNKIKAYGSRGKHRVGATDATSVTFEKYPTHVLQPQGIEEVPETTQTEDIPDSERNTKLKGAIAKMMYKTMLFEKFAEDAEEQKTWLDQKNSDKDADNVGIHLSNLVEAYQRKNSPTKPKDPDSLTWPKESDTDYVQGRLARIEQEAEPMKGQLDERAEKFGPKDYFAALRKIKRIAKKLPEEYRQTMLEYVHVPLDEVDPQRLQEGQAVTANIIYGTALVQEFINDSILELPFQSKKIENESKSKNEIQAQHVSGLLDASKALNADEKAMHKFKVSYGEIEAHYYLDKVKDIQKAMEPIKNEIFEEAESFEPFDNKLALNETRKYAKKLPEEIRQVLYEHVGVSQEEMKSKLAKMGITGSAFAMSWLAIDGMATATAFATIGLNNLSNKVIGVGLEDLNTPTLIGILASSYVYWGHEMRKNFHANFDALEQEGISSNALSKIMYDYASGKTDSEKLRRLAANTGYAATELIKEIPWLVTFLALPTKEAIVAYIGANIGAGLYERGAETVTRKILTSRRERYNLDFFMKEDAEDKDEKENEDRAEQNEDESDNQEERQGVKV